MDLECGWKVTEARRKQFTKEIAEREIRLLELPELYWAASCLKKEKEERESIKIAEDNEFRTDFQKFSGCLRGAGRECR